MEDIKIFFYIKYWLIFGYWNKKNMELFFCLRYRKEDFGFDIRIGLWQVNERRRFSIGFLIVTQL